MNIKLRGGAKTKDPRLDRIPEFDPRSRNYPIRAIVAEQDRKTARSRNWKLTTILNQKNEGACVGAAWTHELMATPQPIKGLDMTFAREKVYWRAQQLDDWEGGSYPNATPFYEGTSTLAGAKAIMELGGMTEYRWAFSLDDLILALGYVGPVVVGTAWYSGMYGTNSDGFLEPSGTVIGGHEYLVTAVDLKGDYIAGANSWGTGWGNNGFWKMSLATMYRLLREDGDACVPVHRKRKLLV